MKDREIEIEREKERERVHGQVAAHNTIFHRYLHVTLVFKGVLLVW